MILILGVVVAPRIFVYYYPNSSFNLQFSEEEILEKKKDIEKVIASEKKANHKKKSKYSKPKCLFDPNQYSENDWLKLGLSEKQVKVILKFSERGLYSNSDLKKIFVIPDELFVLMKDSTFYPKRTNQNVETIQESTSNYSQTYDLNLIDEHELESLPGIGPFYARKIVEYRDELGGYCNVSQLREIWKFDSLKLDRVAPFVFIESDDLHFEKMDINVVSFDVLRKHPYISYQVANSIVKMRAQKRFEALKDLKRSVLIDEQLYRKIKPYLICL